MKKWLKIVFFLNNLRSVTCFVYMVGNEKIAECLSVNRIYCRNIVFVDILNVGAQHCIIHGLRMIIWSCWWRGNHTVTNFLCSPNWLTSTLYEDTRLWIRPSRSRWGLPRDGDFDTIWRLQSKTGGKTITLLISRMALKQNADNIWNQMQKTLRIFSGKACNGNGNAKISKLNFKS